MRRLLQDLGWNFTIEPYIVFINPDFYLYQAPLDLPIIFPGQIKQFFNNNTNVELSKLNDKHLKLAKQLLSCHLESSPYKKIPEYNYDQLHKGIICVNCHSLLVDINVATFKERTLVCSKCSCRERVESAVIEIARKTTRACPVDVRASLKGSLRTALFERLSFKICIENVYSYMVKFTYRVLILRFQGEK